MSVDRRETFIGSDRPLARLLVRPVRNFLHIEAAGGLVLLVATAAALIWANSPAHESYHEFWHTHIELRLGSFEVVDLSYHQFVNDALMAIFFFVVGLEIKREMVIGELRNPRAAAMPALAALGGMLVPAAIYAALNAGGPGSGGWGIPMATDIAFALGVVALLGSRVPASLKVFLLTLAIVDDIGGIVVIALYYTEELDLAYLALAVGLIGLVIVLQRARVWYVPLYVLVGAAAWWAMHESGVHATIAGVILGLATPARPLLSHVEADEIASVLESHEDISAEDVREISFRVAESVPVVDRLEHALHPVTSFVIVPLFALSNAGIELSRDVLGAAVTEPVTIGVFLGLVVGKPVGVLAFTWLGARLGLPLPRGANWFQITAIGVAAGIGFTVALFIDGLAFEAGDPLLDEAKIGILAASMVAALGALFLLRRACPVAVGAELPRPASPARIGDEPDHRLVLPDARSTGRAPGGTLVPSERSEGH